MENLNNHQKLLLKIMLGGVVAAVLGLALDSVSRGSILGILFPIGALVAGISFVAFLIILIGIAIKEGKN